MEGRTTKQRTNEGTADVIPLKETNRSLRIEIFQSDAKPLGAGRTVSRDCHFVWDILQLLSDVLFVAILLGKMLIPRRLRHGRRGINLLHNNIATQIISNSAVIRPSVRRGDFG